MAVGLDLMILTIKALSQTILTLDPINEYVDMRLSGLDLRSDLDFRLNVCDFTSSNLGIRPRDLIQ